MQYLKRQQEHRGYQCKVSSNSAWPFLKNVAYVASIATPLAPSDAHRPEPLAPLALTHIQLSRVTSPNCYFTPIVLFILYLIITLSWPRRMSRRHWSLAHCPVQQRISPRLYDLSSRPIYVSDWAGCLKCKQLCEQGQRVRARMWDVWTWSWWVSSLSKY